MVNSVNTPAFSVVIPTYNRAGFIQRTIRSVLAQTFENFEVIVVDDGSTDNTGEIVEGIGDNRVLYHRKENEERAVARNTGRNLASGGYVTFLDSDDVVYPNHLAVAAEMIGKYNDPEWFHLHYEWANAGNQKRKVNPLPQIANEILVNGNHLSCDGVFLRKDIADAMPFNTDRALSGTEDYELWLRLASRYPLYCDERITSALVEHPARSVVTMDRGKLVRRIELLEQYVLSDDQFLEKFQKDLGMFKANNRVYISLHLALTKEDRLGAVKYLGKALLYSPKVLSNRAFYGTLKRLVI